MWMQLGRIWRLDKIEFSVDLEAWSKNAQLKIEISSQMNLIVMKEIRHVKKKINK